MGYQAIELDVRLSADKQCVVIHDPTLDRTTAHSGAVAEYTAGALAGMNAAAHFEGWDTAEPVATLDACLECLRGVEGIWVMVEVKRHAAECYPMLCRQICDLGIRHGLQNRMVLASFDPLFVKTAARGAADFSRALIGGGDILAGNAYGCDWAMMKHTDVRPDTVRQAQAAGIRVACWTPNTQAELQHIMTSNPDMVITDAPSLAKQLARRTWPAYPAYVDYEKEQDYE